MTYQELCMAAKHEEKRQTELKKRQDYNDSLRYNKEKFVRKPSDNRLNFSHSGAARSAVKDTPNKIRCYYCHKLGHVAANCKSADKEQEATGNLRRTQREAPNRGKLAQLSLLSHQSKTRRRVPSLMP